ncbi:hypothetical protein CXB51_005019 [Gossypium anomalum]|uniref:Uncharacterized protein n=1 Tax=Gossypium anomalum TaxID=47600 RepID=A0A8J6D989_9ROSI|nr:hypothetical protein CXB51_005019 [Gossypium anomalum]
MLFIQQKGFSKALCALALNPNLKPVILSSLLDPLQVVVNQALQKQNKDIRHITVGELQQEVFIALEDICNRRRIFKYYLHGDKRIDRACDDSHLKYKCARDQLCDCRTKKKKHFRKHSLPKNTSRWRRKKKPQWRYLKKKRRTTKSDSCYICNQKGHFSKNYPKNKKAKRIAQMVRQSGIKLRKKEDIESVYSIEDEPSDRTVCAILACFSDSSESDYSEIQLMQAKVQSVSVDIIPIPQIPVKIYLDKYSKHITIIAFIDTGAAETIMNPDVLPSEWWKPHIRYFNSAVNHPFATHLINSHSEFLNKCPNPLWKNSELFIHLPFKKNEDINPTKASHQGMNPNHLLLAEQECKDLQQQDLIEPLDSQWAFEAFYVNKRSEQIRGKLRLTFPVESNAVWTKDYPFTLSESNDKDFSSFDGKCSSLH